MDWMDFIMDPAEVLYNLTGKYEEGLGMQEAFKKLLLEVYGKGRQKAAENQKDFLLVESDLVKGCRRPSVVEIRNQR